MHLGISVFFPAFNDEATIAPLVRNALELLPRLADDFEVIVVNDGSTDGTARVLDELAALHPRVRVVHHPQNRGYGGALRTGFATAQKDLVFYTDGDGQYDVGELARLRPLLTDGVDVVNGYKRSRADDWRRRALGTAYNRLAHLLFYLPVRDVDCDFRLVRRSAMEGITLESSSGSICVELVYRLHRAGCVFAETAVHHYPRVHGRSQFFTPARVARTARDLLALWTKLVVLRRPQNDIRQTDRGRRE
ncbi:MAG TPA: glycosyltransferase family 2 protein [Longimicrobium sp.]|jgi:glycosyltransferase involved in cell wall biosynthesis|uniref:glycosyltransferase family 2 protein n=1 Tax=Longimicrobium sp. TaxID=2029185 RepID=UPI002EDB54E3